MEFLISNQQPSGYFLCLKYQFVRCTDFLPATVNVVNGGSIINSGRNNAATISLTNLSININRGSLLLGNISNSFVTYKQ